MGAGEGVATRLAAAGLWVTILRRSSMVAAVKHDGKVAAFGTIAAVSPGRARARLSQPTPLSPVPCDRIQNRTRRPTPFWITPHRIRDKILRAGGARVRCAPAAPFCGYGA